MKGEKIDKWGSALIIFEMSSDDAKRKTTLSFFQRGFPWHSGLGTMKVHLSGSSCFLICRFNSY